VIPKYGWDKYSKVNLQYQGQVVASIKGIEDIEADSMRALQIMKAVAEYSEKAANDTSRSLLLDNASNSTDISFIMQSLQRDEVDADTAISINASAKKTNIIINKEIVNKTKQSPVKNSIKAKPSTQKK
jgi:spore cortex formation protein SpoVR/YcgB (stage V sporulation)